VYSDFGAMIFFDTSTFAKFMAAIAKGCAAAIAEKITGSTGIGGNVIYNAKRA
jgi:hypothetical protein